MEKKLKNAIIMNRLTKIMFVLGFLLTSMWSYSSNSVYAQNQKFSFEFKQTSIKTIFQYIEKHSEFIFMYRTDLLDTSKKVSVKVEKQSIEQILEQVLKGTSVVYEINDRQIVLEKGLERSEEVPQQSRQNKLIQGLVKDDKGDVIIGATIKVKGTTIGTTTNMDGLYNLSVPSENSILIVSYIGYVTQEIKVGNRQNIIITLKEDTKSLDEVVVTAYGVGQKKESMVGSVQQIKPNELKVPSSNLSNSFAGRLAGVIAVSRSGEPGADGANFWIRGTSTFSGATNALIILDGVEITSSQLNSLDPEVIDGFSILKDATATALYGTRGANGVMIVTTKTGADLSKPIINFRIEGAMSQLSKVPQFVDGTTYMELYNEAMRQSHPDGFYSEEQIYNTCNRVNPYVYPDVNWYDEMFKKNSFAERINFNIRGGNKRVDYFMSASLKHSDGNLKSLSKNYYSYNNNISVYNYDFVNNLNIQATPTTKVSLGLTVQVKDWSGPNTSASDIFASAMNANPVDFPVTWPAEKDDSFIRWGGKVGSANGSYLNPVGEYVRGYSSSFTNYIVANFKVNQKLDMILKGLRFSGLFSYKSYLVNTVDREGSINQFELDQYNNISNTYTTQIVGSEKNTALSTSSTSTGNRSMYVQAIIDYARTFGVHDINVMFLYNMDQYNTNKPADLFASLPKRRQGIAGRVSYAYDGKYLVETNFGYNGSENFAKGKRYGFFPSVAIGYNISAEKFWKPLEPYISHLKLRASWGLVGNDQTNVGRFSYLEDLAFGSASFTTGNEMNYTASGPTWKRIYNPNMTWEIGEKINLGADFRFFKDISLTFDIFKETRRNIFMNRQTVPEFLGFGSTTIAGNLGKMQNKGFDVALDYNKQVTKDFFLSLKGTFTYAKNKILERDEPLFQLYPNLSSVGHSANQLLMYVADGLFSTDNEVEAYYSQAISTKPQAGDIRYKNIPNTYGEIDDKIDSNDRMYMGYPTVPQIVYGFGPSLKYKNIDFSFFFQGTGQTSLMISGIHPFATPQYKRGVLDFIAEDHWSVDNPNPSAAYPRLIAYQDYSGTNNTVSSTYWLRDASFLKLKNLEIGYTINKNMRIYMSGMNLLTFSKFKLWDPEMGGGSGMKYPTQRTFNLGFQMTIK